MQDVPAAPGVSEQALGPYLRALRRHWQLVVAITLLTGVVAAATSLSVARTYEATATVLVSPLQQGDTNFVNTGVVLETGEPVRTVQTAAALVDSLPAAQKTAATMGRGWTAARVQNATNVIPLGESDLLDISAQGATAAEAMKLANAFAQAAVGYRSEVVQRNISAQLNELNRRLSQIQSSGVAEVTLAQQLATRIATLRAAQVGGDDPTLAVNGLARTAFQIGTSRLLLILLALIGGFAIATVAALAVDFFNQRVRDLDEVEELLPTHVLAAVPNIGGAGRQGLLRPESFSPAAFEQIRMLRVQLASRKQAPVVMVTSSGTGDGKTTTAAALAAAFAETGEEVILMDLDLRKPDISRLLELKQPRAVDVTNARLADLLIEVPDLPHVRALLAPRGDVAQFSVLLTRLPRLLDEAEARGGHVIVDAAPVGIISESLEIAKLCDQVVMVVRLGHTDRKRLVLTNELLIRANAPGVGAVVVGATAKADDTYAHGYGYGYQPGDHARAEGDATEGAVLRNRARAQSA